MLFVPLLQVYILTSSGQVYLLCPVAPFGSSIDLAEAQDLHASAEEDSESASTTAWLHQVRLCIAQS